MQQVIRGRTHNGEFMDTCPFSYFLSLFSLCPSFLRPVSLEATQVPLSLNSAVPSYPLTFCSTCSDLLGVFPGTCFPTYDLVHPSEIKHSPSVLLGFTSGFPSWPRFRFELGLRGPRACLIAQLVKNPPAMQETWVRPLGWEDPWRRERLTTPVFLPGKSHGWRNLAGYSSRVAKSWTRLSD